MNRIRTSSVLVLGLLACLSVPQLLFAGQPVDPATLNPPPNPLTTVCEKDGNQTICTLQFSDPPFAGGSGVICGTGPTAYEVFQFQNRSVIGKRYYDQRQSHAPALPRDSKRHVQQPLNACRSFF